MNKLQYLIGFHCVNIMLQNYSDVLLIKHAKPNQPSYFVRYNRAFAITVIVITEFDCTRNLQYLHNL